MMTEEMEEAIKFKQELLGKEYGSNIQKLCVHLTTIEDKLERTEKANLLYKLVEKLHPSIKYAENGKQKIWEDLYLMSGEKLDVDVDFIKPDLKSFLAKPQKVEYDQSQPHFKHYGRNIELLIEKLGKESDKELIENSIEGVGKLMKTFYRNWNDQGVGDGIIAAQMEKLSDGKVKVAKDSEVSFDSPYYKPEKTNVRTSSNYKGKSSNSNSNNRNNNNRNNNNRNINNSNNRNSNNRRPN